MLAEITGPPAEVLGNNGDTMPTENIPEGSGYINVDNGNTYVWHIDKWYPV
jgi:hypothetical protein